MKEHQIEIDFEDTGPYARFFLETCEKAAMNGVQVRMLATPMCGPTQTYNGNFSDEDHDNPFLEVACGKPLEEWIQVFVHEASHMDQFIEKSPAWTGQMVTDEYDSLSLLMLWMDGLVELNPKQLYDYVRRSLTVEWDCERRTLKKIAEHDLPINAMEYAQKANSYIWFYRCWLMEHRKWYKAHQEPWNNRKIWPRLAGMLAPTAGGYMDPPAPIQRLYDEHMVSGGSLSVTRAPR